MRGYHRRMDGFIPFSRSMHDTTRRYITWALPDPMISRSVNHSYLGDRSRKSPSAVPKQILKA